MNLDTGNPLGLRSALAELRLTTPGLPMREAASAFGISEGELLAAHCGAGVKRLDGDWVHLLSDFDALGPVLLLTRNEHAILQQIVPNSRPEINGVFATANGPGRELLLHHNLWAHGFAVEDPIPQGFRRSLQFFDGGGYAVHKVFLQEASAHLAFEALVTSHLHENQSPVFRASFGKRSLGPCAPEPSRLLGMWRVKTTCIGGLLLEVAAKNIQLQSAVGSTGALQSLWGAIGTLQRRGPWLRVLDPLFNLALNMEEIASIWVARGPGEEKGPYWLQLLNGRNESIAELKGSTPAWNELLYALPLPEA